jgi:zinc protease
VNGGIIHDYARQRVTMTETILRTVLPNGLQVNLKEVHAAPLISFWVWYRVGSKDEPNGRTGISHWVEHMQFKGTPQFPASMLAFGGRSHGQQSVR